VHSGRADLCNADAVDGAEDGLAIRRQKPMLAASFGTSPDMPGGRDHGPRHDLLDAVAKYREFLPPRPSPLAFPAAAGTPFWRFACNPRPLAMEP
jgi:hypothetical protein